MDSIVTRYGGALDALGDVDGPDAIRSLPRAADAAAEPGDTSPDVPDTDPRDDDVGETGAPA
jgi:hypothetical protein